MSYCRFASDSDVFLLSTRDGIECLECRLEGGVTYRALPTKHDAVLHLVEHLAVGHRVPVRAFDRLLTEIATDARAEVGRRLHDALTLLNPDVQAGLEAMRRGDVTDA